MMLPGRLTFATFPRTLLEDDIIAQKADIFQHKKDNELLTILV